MLAVIEMFHGRAQRVQDGEVLLGLFSWQLYPNVYAIGIFHLKIMQNDSLFVTNGLLTFVLDIGVRWERSDKVSAVGRASLLWRANACDVFPKR